MLIMKLTPPLAPSNFLHFLSFDLSNHSELAPSRSESYSTQDHLVVKSPWLNLNLVNTWVEITSKSTIYIYSINVSNWHRTLHWIAYISPSSAPVSLQHSRVQLINQNPISRRDENRAFLIITRSFVIAINTWTLEF